MSAYVVNDMESSMRHLSQLMSVICDIHYETPPGKTDDRLDGLLWIARDLTEGIYAHHENTGTDHVALNEEGRS